MNRQVADKFIAEATKQLGAPYVWAAKGLGLSGEEPKPAAMVPAFDCSGLVTHSMWVATGVDHRAFYGSQALFNSCKDVGDLILKPELTLVPFPGWLYFCGKNPRNISHVGIYLGPSMVLEAAGGDHTTISVALAKARGARVRIGPQLRRDIVGYGLLKELM